MRMFDAGAAVLLPGCMADAMRVVWIPARSLIWRERSEQDARTLRRRYADAGEDAGAVGEYSSLALTSGPTSGRSGGQLSRAWYGTQKGWTNDTPTAKRHD